MGYQTDVFFFLRKTVLETNYLNPDSADSISFARNSFTYSACLDYFAGDEIQILNLIRFFQLMPRFLVTAKVKELTEFYQRCSWQALSAYIRRFNDRVYVSPPLFVFILADLAAASGAYPQTPSERETVFKLLFNAACCPLTPSAQSDGYADRFLYEVSEEESIKTKDLLDFYVYLTGRPVVKVPSKGVIASCFVPAQLNSRQLEQIDLLRQKIFN